MHGMDGYNMNNLRTIRGQSARITENNNGKFIIELYANSEWCKPCGHNQEFNSVDDAVNYFNSVKNYIHC